MKGVSSISSLVKIRILALGVLWLCGLARPTQAQSVTWQLLPLYQTDWPGPFGQPATTNGNLITLYGQPVRTVQSFSSPVRISYDVLLPARTTTDGGLQMFFIPTGLASNQIIPDLLLYMTYRNYAPGDILQIVSNGSAVLWGDVPFSITAQTTYHVTIDVSASGGLTWIINNITNSIPNTVTVPYNPFQLELQGWQPGDVWQVSNFTVTPVSTCPSIVGTWSGPVNVADPQSGYHTATLSIQVTDQNTNGCLLRGYLDTGSSAKKLGFTGTVLDTAGVILNLGGSGQASADLDLSQTPPVMKKFIFLPTAGTAGGSTAVGDLIKQPSP